MPHFEPLIIVCGTAVGPILSFGDLLLDIAQTTLKQRTDVCQVQLQCIQGYSLCTPPACCGRFFVYASRP